MEKKENVSQKTVLFSSWRSSCSYRVRICLNFKSISHEIKAVNQRRKAEKPDFNPNPMGYLPALLIDGKTLIESMAILEYLDETRPEYPLMPKDSYERAQVRALCEIVVSGIQPLQNTGVLKRMGGNAEAWAQHWIVKGFTAIEKILAECSGKYCVGDKITLADCCLVPMVYNARLFHIDLERFANIVRIDRLLHDHHAFRSSHPMMQDDFHAESLTDPSLAKL